MKKKLSAFKLPLWKRIFDIIVSLTAIIVLSPFFIIIALAIKIESKGPIIYKSKRVGCNYLIFDFLKFRSMYVDADKHLKEFDKQNKYCTEQETFVNQTDIILPSIDEIDKAMLDGGFLVSDEFTVDEEDYLIQKETKQGNTFVKIENDPRITKVGHFMRKYSIDELPQLINILKGDMSVVGNRPLPLYEAELLTGDEHIDRFMGPAGLTGLWQVEKRGQEGKLSPEERKQLDMKYARNFSFLLDIKIILKTFTAFIQKDDV